MSGVKGPPLVIGLCLLIALSTMFGGWHEERWGGRVCLGGWQEDGVVL